MNTWIPAKFNFNEQLKSYASLYFTTFSMRLLCHTFASFGTTMKLLYKQEQDVRKSLVICATQLAGDLLLKMLEYFKVVLKFLNSPA